MRQNKIDIRMMETADLDDVAALEREIFSTPWSRESFKKAIESESNIYVVAYEAKELIGYCGIWMVADEGQINNVAVAIQFRNQHIAANMLDFAMSLCREKKINNFTLEVRAGNAPAIHLYEKIGFRNYGVRKKYYKNPDEDAVIMWLYDA